MGAADVLKRLRRKSVGSGTAPRPKSAGEDLPIRPGNLCPEMPLANQPPSSYRAPASSGPTQIADDHSPELSQHELRVPDKGPQQQGGLDSAQGSPVARTSIDKPLPAPPLFHQNQAHGSSNVKEALAKNTNTPIADAFATALPLPPTKSPGRAQEQNRSSQPIVPASSAAFTPSHAHRSEQHPNPSDGRSPVHPIHVDESNITERTVETDSNVTWNRPVVHETIRPTEHEERRELITRHIHNHHVIHRILPVKDVRVLPAKHYAPLGPGGALVEIPAPPGEVPGQSQSWTIVANPIANATGENPYPWLREVYKKDEKSYVTTDGIRRTETTWIHPARLEEGAIITGQSAPFEFTHTRTRDGSESTYYTASGSSNTSATTIAYRLEDQTRLNREAEEVVRRAEALAIDVKHDKGASTYRKKPLTAPAIPERKTPIHSRGPSVSHEDELSSSVPASHGRARATSNVQSRAHAAGPSEGARSSLDNAGATSRDAAQSARMPSVASSKPKKSAGHQPRSSQEVIDAAIAGLTGPNSLRAYGP